MGDVKSERGVVESEIVVVGGMEVEAEEGLREIVGEGLVMSKIVVVVDFGFVVGVKIGVGVVIVVGGLATGGNATRLAEIVKAPSPVESTVTSIFSSSFFSFSSFNSVEFGFARLIVFLFSFFFFFVGTTATISVRFSESALLITLGAMEMASIV